MYSPCIIQWLQPDTVVPEPYNPHDWNRYSYVRKNPIRFNDPTGHVVACDKDDADCSFHWDYPPPTDQLKKYSKKLSEKQERNHELFMAASEIVVSVIYEPADWLLTYDDYKQNGFNPWMLLGFLPFIPGGAGRHADDVVDLYRAVGPDELADIEKTGILRVDLSGKNFSTGKWFATTSEDANKWGEAMSAWDNKGFSVIQVEAPKSILSKLDFVPKLDGIGPAYFAPANMLNFFKVIK